jgi:acetyltransferase-like isoleucine patch superfamily enzyme
MTGPRIAASAVIEDGAEIGDGSVVWDLTQVRAGARIGAGCTVGRNVFVDAGVVVGDRCKVQNNALLFAPAIVADGVFIGPAVVLTNDRHPRAVDPSGTVLVPGAWEPTPVSVGTGAALGAGSVVVAGVSIGEWALVGAGSVVTADVPAHALVVGTPARRVGWVGRGGARLEPDDGPDSLLRCPDTGDTFIDHGAWVEPR